MQKQISETAGVLWYTLGKQGCLPVTNLTKYVKGNKDVAHIALGWLARENKVKFENKGKVTHVCLTNEETEIFKRTCSTKTENKTTCCS